MWRIFILFTCIFSSADLFLIGADTFITKSDSNWRAELQEIDAELNRLEEEQIKLKLAQTRWTDKGMSWQFQQNMTQEARRAFQKADEAAEQMKINQQHIDILKARRQKIIQEHPEANEIQGSP